MISNNYNCANSLIPLANIITNPVIMLLHARGSGYSKEYPGPAWPQGLMQPFRDVRGLAEKPSRAELMRKGKTYKCHRQSNS